MDAPGVAEIWHRMPESERSDRMATEEGSRAVTPAEQQMLAEIHLLPV